MSSHPALVLSGGGAKGAYAVGVLKALTEGSSHTTNCEPLEARIFTGTSVGAYNAAFLVARHRHTLAEAVTELEGVWRERIANTMSSCGNGVYRFRGDLVGIFDPACLLDPVQRLTELGGDASWFADYLLAHLRHFADSQGDLLGRSLATVDFASFISVEPLQALLRDTVDLERLGDADDALTIAAANFRQGTARLFCKREIADQVGHAALQASAAVPGFFPAVEIEGQPYVDGGLVLNTPLKPAIDAGADELHVIYSDPMVGNIPFPPVASTVDTLYRVYAFLIADRMRQDIERAREISHMLVELDRPLRGGEHTHPQARRILSRGRAALRRHREGRPYRHLVIHRYRPRTDLGGFEGLLDFSYHHIDTNIRQGFEETLGHDCEDSQCVVRLEERVG